MDIAVGNPDFSILVAALNAVELTSVLQGDGPFTVFAPTNDAFTALLSALSLSESELLQLPDLESILLYHVVSGYFTTSVLTEDLYSDLLTINGQRISIQSEGSTISVVDAQGSTANVAVPDIMASNGVIHVIDAVLLPLFDSVFSIAANLPDFTILVAAVESVHLDDELMNPRASLTVFAPTNSAFFALIQALEVSIQDILDIPSLDSILLHHVLGMELTTTEIAEKEGEPVMTLNGQTLSFQVDGETIVITDAMVRFE